MKKPLNLGMVENEISTLYHNGQGVPQDIKKAEYWAKRAAENGNANAIEYLEEMKEIEASFGGNK